MNPVLTDRFDFIIGRPPFIRYAPIERAGRLIHGDCLEELAKLEDKSVSFVLTDLPYQMTDYKWDCQIPFSELWKQWKRVLKPNGVVALFASGKFVGQVMTSNMEGFKYSWVWVKSNATNFANAKKQPMRKFENILVFYDKQPTYNPQGVRKLKVGEVLPSGAGGPDKRHSGNGVREKIDHGAEDGKIMHSGFKERPDGSSSQSTEIKISRHIGNGVSVNSNRPLYFQQQTGYPSDVLYFSRQGHKRDWNNFHPTQKPLELLRYLIKTHSNPGDTVLDCTAGSMSTGIAALMEGRQYIMIEKDEEYFRMGAHRVSVHEKQMTDKI